MPTYLGQVSEESLFQLIAYVKSLAVPAAPGEATTVAAGKPPDRKP
jgi:hypothetical protein